MTELQNTNAKTNEKKRSERRKHCALAVVTQSQKFSPRRRSPSRGRRTAKIWSAGDGHYLHLQTQFGEDRCTQFRVIVVTDPQTNNARPPVANTERQDRYQYTAPLSLARSIMSLKPVFESRQCWCSTNVLYHCSLRGFSIGVSK